MITNSILNAILAITVSGNIMLLLSFVKKKCKKYLADQGADDR